MISSQTVNWAGVAAGVAVGAGVGAVSMGLLGRTQEKADASGVAKQQEHELRSQRDAVRQRLDDGVKAGSITVREQRDLERQVRELDTKLKDVDGTSRLISENWPLIPGAIGIGAAKFASGKLDDSMNWSWKQVVTKPSSQFDFIGVPVGSGTKYGMVRDAPIARTFMPSFAAGVAGGLAAGMLGARLVQQFVNRPSS